MAEAIIAKLSHQPEYTLTVIQRNPEKAARLRKLYPVAVMPRLTLKLSPSDWLILAIKPQDAKAGCQAIAALATAATVISLMAGVTIASISTWLHNPRLIRALTNTPARIGLGVSVIYFSANITVATQQLVSTMFSQLGITSVVAEENALNQALPISSSAIAFVYYFMEGLINNAVSQFGLTPTDATRIITQVVSGSIGLLQEHPQLSIGQQRALVTSAKGTTAHGLLTLEQGNFHALIGQAMHNCYLRGLELANQAE